MPWKRGSGNPLTLAGGADMAAPEVSLGDWLQFEVEQQVIRCVVLD
jgi:hypothetical protein